MADHFEITVRCWADGAEYDQILEPQIVQAQSLPEALRQAASIRLQDWYHHDATFDRADPMENRVPQAEMTTADVASLLRKSVKTVERYRQEGLLPSYRVGKGVRFKRDDVMAFRDQHYRPQPGETSPGSR